jgi:rhodanese-related sulfurtransferase
LRGGAAASALGKLGFREVQSLRGGHRAWKDAGLPTQKI